MVRTTDKNQGMPFVLTIHMARRLLATIANLSASESDRSV